MNEAQALSAAQAVSTAAHGTVAAVAAAIQSRGTIAQFQALSKLTSEIATLDSAIGSVGIFGLANVQDAVVAVTQRMREVREIQAQLGA